MRAAPSATQTSASTRCGSLSLAMLCPVHMPAILHSTFAGCDAHNPCHFGVQSLEISWSDGTHFCFVPSSWPRLQTLECSLLTRAFPYCLVCGVQAFAQTLQQSRGFGTEFRFPDQPASATTPAGQAAAAGATQGFANGAADDDDDLYS